MLDHARETYGDRETRVEVVDINGVKNASKRRRTTTVRALFSVFLVLADC